MPESIIYYNIFRYCQYIYIKNFLPGQKTKFFILEKKNKNCFSSNLFSILPYNLLFFIYVHYIITYYSKYHPK